MKHYFLIFAMGGLLMAGCRGMESRKPPIQPNLNMDFQVRYDPQEANPFFEDGRAMRPTVRGTIARGQLREDEAFYNGTSAGNQMLDHIPVPVTRALLERGQQRFGIYCAVCHGYAGDGQGIMMTGNYGFTPAPSFHDPRLLAVQEGYIFNVITNGMRTMPPYAQQIAVADRWAIVAYVRALQRTENASVADVPLAERAGLSPVATPAAMDSTAPSGAAAAPAADSAATP